MLLKEDRKGDCEAHKCGQREILLSAKKRKSWRAQTLRLLGTSKGWKTVTLKGLQEMDRYDFCRDLIRTFGGTLFDGMMFALALAFRGWRDVCLKLGHFL